MLITCQLLGCSHPPAELTVVSTKDLGPVTFPASIRGRDGGHSAWFGARSVWAFGDTMLAGPAADGESWRNSTFATTVPSPAGLTFTEPLDSTGSPGLLIPWTDDEAIFNRSQSAPACTTGCQPKWVNWPAQLLVDPATGEGLLFYLKLRDWKSAGKSLARWKSPQDPVSRPVVAPGTPEPTLLFPDGDVEPITGGLAAGETVYAYDCKHGCIVGRVGFADAFNRSAWTFFAGDGRWVADWHQAKGLFGTPSLVSFEFNAFLGRYLAVYADGDRAVARTAPAPEGPWSDPIVLAQLTPPEGGGPIYDVLAHVELALDDGQKIFLSYSRATGSFLSEMRLVEVDLGKP